MMSAQNTERTGYIDQSQYDMLESACRSIRVMLISSINTAKGNIN